MFYKQSDFRLRHEANHMTGTSGTPEQQTPSGQVIDAVPENWVDTTAPAFSRPYLRLSRADRPIGTWLLLLPCWWGVLLAAASDPRGLMAFDLWIIVGCAIGAFLMRGAGCTWNDITDREFDAQVARTKSRPIPSGQVSLQGAFIWLLAQALLAFCILITFNMASIVLGVAALLPVAIYPFAKRFTWWPQVFLGLAFNWGALLAWTAHTGSLGWPAVLLYLGGIAWTLFYDTIYAHQDKEDDALIGVKSTARLFGDQTSRWLRFFLVAAVLLVAAAILLAMLPDANPLTLVLALAGAWAFGWHLAWQLRNLDIDDWQACLKLFRSNRDAGLVLALFFAAAALL
ncbi:MAG: 4-hydroxybenzoate octaprenyltransferase [Paracoccaceae bacterium]